jgi:hypothetical protein
MPGEKVAAESPVGRETQLAEKALLFLTEPIPPRFGRKETNAVQRLKIDGAAVSQVRSDRIPPVKAALRGCGEPGKSWG